MNWLSDYFIPAAGVLGFVLAFYQLAFDRGKDIGRELGFQDGRKWEQESNG